jgi:hypothetical protein
MYLLRSENDRCSLTEFHGKDIPRYAILSHTWGPDCDEVTLKDIREGTGRNKLGYNKIRFCEKQASKDDIEYFWIDTCCIDKTSSAELQEAINSMFRWYQKAVKCYVYLSDIKDNDSFQTSRWFTRGWTLQELVAPGVVEFYTVEGKKIGDKWSHMLQIHDITKIPHRVLQGCPLSEISIEERLSWASARETKREEDLAYSLLGIFDVHMPLLYGEGHDNALRRLKEEISKATNSMVSFKNFRSSATDGDWTTEGASHHLPAKRACSETEIMVNHMDACAGGRYMTPNTKRRAQIGGRTGNIKIGGRAQHASTGISMKGHVS